VKWGNDLVFSVGGKMFAVFANDGKDASFGCKVPEEDFLAVTCVAGIRPAPYAARFFWVSVEDPAVLPEREALAMLRTSHELVKRKLPTRVRREIEAEEAAPAKRVDAAKPGGKAKTPARKKRAAGAVAAKTNRPVRAKRRALTFRSSSLGWKASPRHRRG
jgi:predicted DNA-binding protein (MmcQ/YjbR family)